MAKKINSEVVAITIEGQGFSGKVTVVDGSFQYDLGGKTREALMGSGGLLGHTETLTPGTCSFDVAKVEGLDETAFNSITGARLRVQWNGGAEWQLNNAASTAPSTGTAGSGTATQAFSGDPWLIPKT